MTIQLRVPPALESRLRAEAKSRGEEVETVVVRTLIEKFGEIQPPPTNQPRIPAEQFDAELSELAFDGPSLPAHFSRAEIYDDHD